MKSQLAQRYLELPIKVREEKLIRYPRLLKARLTQNQKELLVFDLMVCQWVG